MAWVVVLAPRVLVLVLVLVSTASAAEDPTPPQTAEEPADPVQFSGAFVGAGLIGGLSLLQDSRWNQPVGWTGGAYARVASVLSLIDVQLEYHGAANGMTTGPNTPEDLTLERHSVSTSFNLHPLFLKILGNNWTAFTLSGIYVQGGFSTEFSRYRSDDPAWRRSDIAFSLHFGTGIDMPVGDANGDGAFWIGAFWRWKFVYMDPGLDAAGNAPNELNAHMLLLSVSYRYNNVNFGRLERPDELKFR